MMIKQLEFLDQTVEINQKTLEFYKNILGNADDTMMYGKAHRHAKNT